MKDSQKYIFIFLLIFLLNIIPFLLFPFIHTQDSATYLSVSDNILENHCVSRSTPSSHQCTPDWGGNQLFGYPLFLAVTRIFDHTNYTISVMAQYLLLVGAIFYFCSVLYSKLKLQFRKILVISMLLSWSPFQIAWASVLLTESIVIPLIIILFAEIIKSLITKKMQTITWFIILIIAVFTRYEMVIFCVTVPIVAFSIYSPTFALKKITIIGFLISMPLIIWGIRGAANGLPFPPTLAMGDNSLTYPKGTLAWFKTWKSSSHDDQNIYKIFDGKYSSIRLPDKAFDNNHEKQVISDIMTTLAKQDGKSIPPPIDNLFAEIAKNRIDRTPLRYYLQLPITRIISMMSNITYNSINLLPLSKQGRGLSDANITENSVSMALEHPSNTVILVLSAYKIVLFLILGYLLVNFFKLSVINRTILLTSITCSCLSLLFILTFAISTEPRYLLSSLVVLEIAVIFILASIFPSPHLKREYTD
ncbi:hypothetical protein [Methylobacter sp.]|uniref:hypothetical protein n=1 Tax=Methylobacter sp. TaxID=2051955 RepID=UPI002FDCDB43